jgi:drug/metabolite transporter (DMT)-like permease
VTGDPPLARSASARQKLLFGLLCLIWGSNWLALKVGMTVVPPGFFSGTRWTVAGLLLLAWRWWRGADNRVNPRLLARLTLVAGLMVALNALIQNYGLRLVDSGLAAVISSALTPIALLGFGVLLGQERFSTRQAAAIALGVFGILLLFGPKAARGGLGGLELLGAAGVVVGCLCYSLGSVLSRPLMRVMPPAQVATMTNLFGGLMLLLWSVPFEPGASQAMRFDWGGAAWVSWLFLLGPGSLGGTIIYFALVRDWGAGRAGTYAFVTPVISVALGVFALGERVDLADVAGMSTMLAAAGLALRRR